MTKRCYPKYETCLKIHQNQRLCAQCRLLAHDDDSCAEMFCACWKVVHTIFSRSLRV